MGGMGMKKRRTRRRSALGWTALAAALILLWGVAKGYCFTAGQARRERWASLEIGEMELVLELGRERHPYTNVVADSDYERHVLFADEVGMTLMRETFSILGDGWDAWPVHWVKFTPEDTVILPEATLWLGHYYSWAGNGYLYFRAEGIAPEVMGFSVREELPAADGGADYTVSDSGLDGVDVAELERIELHHDSRGYAYGVIPYYPQNPFYYELNDHNWYLQLELADGRVVRAPFPAA